MKIASLFFKVAPYFYRNHLFVSPLRLSQKPPIIDPEYVISYPAELNYFTNNELLDIDINWKSLNAATKLGNLFCFVICQGRLVHLSMVQTRGIAQMEGDRRAFYLTPNEVYIHSCFTALDHRRKGLYTAVLNRILTTISESKYPSKVFIACRQKNSSSVRGIQQAGFKYLKSSMIVGIFSGRLRIRCWYLHKDMGNGKIENHRKNSETNEIQKD